MRCLRLVLVLAVLFPTVALATETENLGIRVLPADKPLTIDGKAADWNLVGGLLVCGDVENMRDKLGVWVHAMYDADYLYLLARFIDETPLNNPGSSLGDYGFSGDSLQFRTITEAGTPNERGQHFTCWRDRDGIDLIKIEQGTKFKEGVIADAKKGGAKQAFTTNADGRGYVQEIAIPWSLLVRDGVKLGPGGRFNLTVEPNFTVGLKGRTSLKDIFKPGITPDRVFTFYAHTHWGPATLEPSAKVDPRPLRLADGREFAMRMENGLPVIDWTGLIKAKQRRGFKTIPLGVPADGFVSLNLIAPDGSVARQLLTCEFFTKGKHEIPWDGLTTPNWRQPGNPVATGEYRWKAIWHPGIGLRLRGWADNSGRAPWDGRTLKDNWGGDHGIPFAVATSGKQVYLGWTGAEAGQALLACDLQGNVIWKNKRAGIAGAEHVAVDGNNVYAQHWGGDWYRLDSKRGGYVNWESTGTADLFLKDIWEGADVPKSASASDARDGKLYLAFTDANLVLVIDGQTGKVLKRHSVAKPIDVKATSPRRILVSSAGTSILALDPESGKLETVVDKLEAAGPIALDAAGNLYVGVGEPHHQVHVYDSSGKRLRAIGRDGGRALLGTWTPDGMRFIHDLGIDAEGKLWVAEADEAPKRFSVWNTADGAFVKEFFGPTSYGATGGAINPLDPNLMVGQGCEWRLDPTTGRATCVGVIHRGGMSNAAFARSADGRLFLAIASRWRTDIGPLDIYERLGDANYKLRATLFFADADGKELTGVKHGSTGGAKQTGFWSDENGDGQRQSHEIKFTDGITHLNAWYMPLAADMTFYTNRGKFAVTGYTTCGAPKYDLASPATLADPGFQPTMRFGSPDGRLELCDGAYGAEKGWFSCHDVTSGTLKWTYPNNFIGVHGSHKAVPPEVGMVRGSFGPAGAVKLPAPLGNCWVIATNCGEWHILSEDGFYVTRLFQGDPMKVVWPEEATPGAVLDNVPCGMGGEDFGGSVSQDPQGNVYLQSGKTGFWNVAVVGLDQVKSLGGGSVSINSDEVAKAAVMREAYLQEAVANNKWLLVRHTPTFTGNLVKDFSGVSPFKFQKQDDAAVTVAASYDDKNLYLAWDVKDSTPWENGATEASQMYLSGDTVDFQLGADPAAKPNRAEAVAGDLRLSIGNFSGKPTAVLYRPVSDEKKPQTFSSGVVKEYVVQYVDNVPEVETKVTIRKKNGYTVEAIVPLATLGIKPAAGLKLRGDMGVTHGDAAGQRTRLRSYWSNQHTGIVDDAVFELKPEPRYWSELQFE